MENNSLIEKPGIKIKNIIKGYISIKIIAFHSAFLKFNRFAGGYALSSRSLITKDRFVGWIDDLAFHSRILSSSEIEQNWLVND